MKCAIHNLEATAVCPYCGKALCPSCSRSGNDQRAACSDACAAALAKLDKAAELAIRRSLQSVKASAFGCYFSGTVFLLFGIGSFIASHSNIYLAIFLAISGVALIISGTRYSGAAKQQ
jgi:hypothetical protein